MIPHTAIRDLATPVIIESTMARIPLFARVRFDVSSSVRFLRTEIMISEVNERAAFGASHSVRCSSAEGIQKSC